MTNLLGSQFAGSVQILLLGGFNTNRGDVAMAHGLGYKAASIINEYFPQLKILDVSCKFLFLPLPSLFKFLQSYLFFFFIFECFIDNQIGSDGALFLKGLRGLQILNIKG